MRMIHTRFDDIDKSYIEGLISGRIPESRTLEYKQELPKNSDDDKKEFLADISAFANASGGHIIYGISEALDENGKTTGCPGEVKVLDGNADREIRRLEQILLDGLDPRIPGVKIKQVEGFSNGFVIVIKVPKSWNSPHMVTFKNSSRFFVRRSTLKTQLDVTEIRSAFIASESLSERIRQFRSDKIAKIIADETPVPLRQKPKIVLHVLPVESFTTGSSIDISLFEKESIELNTMIQDNRYSASRYNFDGFCTYDSFLMYEKEGVYHSYVQIFRNSSIESVTTKEFSELSLKTLLIKKYCEVNLTEAVKQHLKSLQSKLEINPPILIMISLLGVRGYGVKKSEDRDQKYEIDRDHLIIPELFVQSYDEKVSDILRPAFDAIYQACGYPRSEN
jgi:Putative DNA-binding domain